jgi:hypothetical protein
VPEVRIRTHLPTARERGHAEERHANSIRSSTPTPGQPQARQPQGPAAESNKHTPPLPNTTMRTRRQPHYPRPLYHPSLPPPPSSSSSFESPLWPPVPPSRGCQLQVSLAESTWRSLLPESLRSPPSSSAPQSLDSLQSFAANRIQRPPSLAALACSNRLTQSVSAARGTVHSSQLSPSLTMTDQVTDLISDPSLHPYVLLYAVPSVVQPVDSSLWSSICLSP